ncbi:hypothetical protein [Blautia hansenii]|uniref:hypothetical protein n=1 Tax=Blautia hansenii TaxID=1322 RepID=UPI003983FBFB
MWKIFIEYDDKSKITLTGKHKDIPLRLALEYNRLYVNSPSCVSAKYQRYPKKNYLEMDLMDKIEELELLEVER